MHKKINRIEPTLKVGSELSPLSKVDSEFKFRKCSLVADMRLRSGLKAQQAPSPGQSEAAPWVMKMSKCFRLQGQKRKNQRLFSSIHDVYIYAFAQQGQKHIWKVQPTWPDFSQEKSPSIKRKL